MRAVGNGFNLGTILTMPRRALQEMRSVSALTVVALALLSSCGGGTTGTSPSESLTFSGYAENSNQIRAARLTMRVTAASTNEALVDSGTDDSGDFAMELPADEEAFVVDVPGVAGTTISRQQRGTGTMASRLTVSENGTLAARDLFEVQAISSTLCQRITLSGNTVVILGELGSDTCVVTFAITSLELPIESFTGSLEAACNGTRTTIATVNASTVSTTTGELAIDIAAASECSGLTITVKSTQSSELRSVFRVEKRAPTE